MEKGVGRGRRVMMGKCGDQVERKNDKETEIVKRQARGKYIKHKIGYLQKENTCN